ncbi:MAG: hypothetical protein HYU99_02880 [Deltaproteobacteria bacterium]|nr:hypothetical protein [Deltaproteobacteria bacterium]
MTTTIQVQEKTLRLLKLEKKKLKLDTYDQVIRHLTQARGPVVGKMFGIDRGRLSPFSEDDHIDFHEDL